METKALISGQSLEKLPEHPPITRLTTALTLYEVHRLDCHSFVLIFDLDGLYGRIILCEILIEL